MRTEGVVPSRFVEEVRERSLLELRREEPLPWERHGVAAIRVTEVRHWMWMGVRSGTSV